MENLLLRSTDKKLTNRAARHIAGLLIPSIEALGLTMRAGDAFISDPDKVKNWKEGSMKLLAEQAVLNRFSKERVSPNRDWKYDTGTMPNLDTQVARIMGSLTGVGPVGIGSSPAWIGEITDKADGLMAIPSILDIGAMFEVEDPLGRGYGQILEKVLACLGKERGGKFHNYRNGQLDPNYIRFHEEVRRRREELENAIPHEKGKIRFLLVPVSMGRYYQGYSPRNARLDALELGNLPLDPVTVAFMLIAWPERLNKNQQTFIDCYGCEYSWDADGEWSRVCYFRFDGSRLEFGDGDADIAIGGCGAAVAFPGVSAP